VRGANATERPDPAQEQRYLEAYKKLKKSVRRPDGVIDIVDTDNYKRYLDARQAYVDQLSAYRTAYLNFDMTKPRDQQKWNAIEPSLKGKLDRAYNQMIASRSNELELALSTMNSSINSMIRAVIERTKADYNQSSRASVVGDPAGWHLSYAIPTNWYSSEISPSLSDLTITSDRLNTTASSEFTSWGGGASWNAGLWSIGGGVSGSEREERRHMDGQHFKLRFKFGVVQVRRPWFDSTLLQLGGWSLGEAVPRGGISEGKLAGAEAKLMPLIVTSLIIAREIEVEADWTTEDYKHVEKSISGSTRVGWGPFQFSGSYSHSSSNTTFNSTHDGGVLKVPGLQAMAFVSSIMPYSPPL
jgi:hypothetical protein